MSVSSYRLMHAMSALQQAKQRLMEEDATLAEDSLLLQSMLEGDAQAGDCMDTLHSVLRAAVFAKSQSDAAKALADKMAERAQRYAARAQMLRNAGLDAMQSLELRRIELPDLTASIANGAASVHVTDEAALSDEYVRIKREPNKSAIAAALKAGAEVAGATISNAPPSVRISTR